MVFSQNGGIAFHLSHPSYLMLYTKEAGKEFLSRLFLRFENPQSRMMRHSLPKFDSPLYTLPAKRIKPPGRTAEIEAPVEPVIANSRLPSFGSAGASPSPGKSIIFSGGAKRPASPNRRQPTARCSPAPARRTPRCSADTLPYQWPFVGPLCKYSYRWG
jgi:hypothetical protein